MFNFLGLFLGDSAPYLVWFIILAVGFYFGLKFLDKITNRYIYNIINILCYGILGFLLIMFFIKLVMRVFSI